MHKSFQPKAEDIVKLMTPTTVGIAVRKLQKTELKSSEAVKIYTQRLYEVIANSHKTCIPEKLRLRKGADISILLTVLWRKNNVKPSIQDTY